MNRCFYVVIAACVDRWALTSPNVRIRSICRPIVARYVILALIPIWCLIPMHMAINVTNSTGRCGAPSYYAFAFGMYLLVFIGILPPILMIFFGVFAWYNLKNVRRRVCPIVRSGHYRFPKSDRDLMRMLTGEVCVYVVTTVLYPANVLYGVITAPFASQKSAIRLAVESLIGFIISPLLNYIYCVAPFYSKILILCYQDILTFFFLSHQFQFI